MNRSALVLRNQAMAEAYHRPPPRHYVRRALLRLAAWLPVPEQRPSRQERVLLIRPDHLGDMLLTTPAFHALRQALPGAELHALVGPWSAPVLEHNPDIDRVLTLPFPGFNRSGNDNLHSPYQLAWRTAQNLRKIGYTHAVILRADHWWGALVTFLAGIPVRIGYNVDDTAPFLTQQIAFRHEHAVIQNLRLLTAWCGDPAPADVVYRHHITGEDRDKLADVFHHQADQAYFCIHPGSGTAVKRWENAHWAVVADTLAEQLNATPVFTGGDHERPIVDEITAQMTTPAQVLVGETGVGGLAALFEQAQVVLGPDSGPLHLAAAVHTPTVALFGPADPVEFRQWGPPDRHIILTTGIACRPCRVLDWAGDDPANHPCVREITVGRVLEAARRVAIAK